jgi:hypothetical protein
MKTNKLTKLQQDFIDSKTWGYNLLCMTVHGSTLYGLNHADSDIDIKAIYLPSKRDLLLGQGNKTVNYKNDELDIEIEIKSLPSFLSSLEKCDTNCLDMIHTPDNMTLLSTILWEDIKSERECVYAKNMKGIVGYVKTHTNKYSNKIQRLEELTKLQIYLMSCEAYFDSKGNTLKHSTIKTWLLSNNFKYINIGVIHSDHEQDFLEVCGKKYTMTWSVDTVLSAVEAEINRYGKRTNAGSNSGMDGKALSHALRAIVQLEDLVVNGSITFPLREVELVRKVKFNQLLLEEVVELLDVRFDNVCRLLEDSNLPEFNDLNPITTLLEDYYFS